MAPVARRVWFRSLLALLAVMALGFVTGCPRSSHGPVSGASSDAQDLGPKRRAELFQHAIDNLHRLEEFAPSAMLQQILERLNQWMSTQEVTGDWAPDPMIAPLLAKLPSVAPLKDLGRLEFSITDGAFLQEAAWTQSTAEWARGDKLDDLTRAERLFDWLVRNIQFDPDPNLRMPQMPWETLLLGQGSAADRAWLYVLLCRQQGLDAAVVIPVDDLTDKPEPAATDKPEEKPAAKAEESPAKPEAPAASKPDAASSNSSDKQDKPPADKLADLTSAKPNRRPHVWAVAVRIGDQAYLFDPTLGLPIPAPDGIRLTDHGLAIRPATLAQAASDPKILARLNLDPEHPYRVQSAQASHLAVLLVASPQQLSRRMKLIEMQMSGKDKILLTYDPSAAAEAWKKLPQTADVQIWTYPFEVSAQMERLAPDVAQHKMFRLMPFQAGQAQGLWKGRLLQLKGRFLGEEGATACYQAVRPSNLDLSRTHQLLNQELQRMGHQTSPESTAQEVKKAAREQANMEMMVRIHAKHNASYWLGLMAYERGVWASAIDYFGKRTLGAVAKSPWQRGALYNLGRTYEASGQYAEAVSQYLLLSQMNDWGAALRARWLAAEAHVSTKPAEAKPSETKPSQTKPTSAKPVEAKPAEAKPVEKKPAEKKPVDAKPAAEGKPEAKKSDEKKPDSVKPDAKKSEPAKPE